MELAVHQVARGDHAAQVLAPGRGRQPADAGSVINTDTVREQTLMPIAMVSSAWICRAPIGASLRDVDLTNRPGRLGAAVLTV